MGVAIPLARKSVLENNLAQLGMKTLGDLTTFFITCEGAVDALAPLAAAYNEKKNSRAPVGELRIASNALKGLSSEELAAIVKLATKQKA